MNFGFNTNVLRRRFASITCRWRIAGLPIRYLDSPPRYLAEPQVIYKQGGKL